MRKVDDLLGVTTLLKTAYRAFVYHRTEQPKLVESREEYEQFMSEGWSDTPATFHVQSVNTPKKGRKS